MPKTYDLEVPQKRRRKIKITDYTSYIFGAVGVVCGLVIGVLIGRYGLCKPLEDNSGSDIGPTHRPQSAWEMISPYFLDDGDPSISDKLINDINTSNIRQYLKELSENPHLAGTDADFKQAEELKNFWKSVGLDEVHIQPYDVLLSYPNTTDEDNMNQIQIISSNGSVIYASPLYEKILHPSENKTGVVPPFNAYSSPGVVNSSELIYVNYGRVEDYNYLENHFPSINVSGKIVIARYGKIFRGDKVAQATRHGAIGIIIYSDPADYSDNQTENVYPESMWLPPSGAQRGTVIKTDGDPLTPGYPATDTAYRLSKEEVKKWLPTIPVHPIGYDIASELFDSMTGPTNISQDWKGAMNVTYRLGGPLNNNQIVKMRISTSNQRRKIYDVFGIIRGAIEPDRYVLVGNHRDAWVFGAIDPSSGTAVLKEISRAMGFRVKNGEWRPRRSVIFCSWGAEEYGLIGSNEWVEQFAKNLQTRGVAYLNVDIAVSGNYSFTADASPLLKHVIYETAKRVQSPDTFETLYDHWKKNHPDSKDPTKPRVPVAGSGSDFAPFMQLAGMPIIDVTYGSKKASYPLYHSEYETFYAVETFLDPNFKYHQTVGRVLVEGARYLAEELIVPFEVTDYSSKINELVKQIKLDKGQILSTHSINMSLLDQAAENFNSSIHRFKEAIGNVDRKNPFSVRKVNDQLTLLDKAFLDPQGLPGRPFARHILFAESSVNSYAGSSFPGLVDSLFEIESAPNQEQRWDIVRKHFSVIIFTIESAASTIKNVTKFMS